ncbi:MAG: NAD(P)-binding protein [Woeseiaceae bacterium]
MSKLDISRRDFLNGFALSVAAGGTLSPLELLAQDGRYPPSLTGLRGSHAGSFEVAHAISWGNASWPRPQNQADDTYDLVVVGAGLSGLAAAYMYRARVGGDPNILILDNHDDFGGHAKRNEFDVDGTHLVGYGGSQSIDSPANYSPVSAQMLKDAGVDTEPFYEYFDRSFYRDRNLGRALYFAKEKYGKDSVHPSVLRGGDSSKLAETIAAYPISEAARASFIDLLTSEKDYLADKSVADKKAFLKSISYTEFLRKHVGTDEEVVLILRDGIKGFWGVGYDALSAMEGYRLGMPGAWYMGLEEDSSGPAGREEPYIFHFPDGNAGVARSMVRQLIPHAVPGSTMEDLVMSRVDYDLLDLAENSNRIRLDSTAVDVRHVDGDSAVDVTYVRDGRAERVRGRHAILACYNNLVPHICPDVPKDQVEAINQAVKIPLVYINIAVRNWKAFENLGYQSFSIPQPKLMHSFGMDFPVSMGGYEFTQNSDQPTVLHGTYVPARPDEGLSEREQHKQGRRDLLQLTFADFERDIVSVMDGALQGGGFDAERDIAAITVNRWPHGYAYEYNELFDPPEWSKKDGPHLIGARQMGRISIANSDASAYAYVDGAFDAADRAVNEQLNDS